MLVTTATLRCLTDSFFCRFVIRHNSTLSPDHKDLERGNLSAAHTFVKLDRTKKQAAINRLATLACESPIEFTGPYPVLE